MNFPVTYEQVITQTVEEAPGTSSYMDETPYHTPDEGSSFDMVGSAERSLGQSLIGQIEPSRMMREVDVTFVEGEPPEWDSVKRFRKRDAGKRGKQKINNNNNITLGSCYYEHQGTVKGNSECIRLIN